MNAKGVELSTYTVENLVEDVLIDIMKDPAKHLTFEEFFDIIKNYAPSLTVEQLEEVGQELGFWLQAQTRSEHQFDLKEG